MNEKYKIKIWDGSEHAVFKAREGTPEDIGKAVKKWLEKYR